MSLRRQPSTDFKSLQVIFLYGGGFSGVDIQGWPIFKGGLIFVGTQSTITTGLGL